MAIQWMDDFTSYGTGNELSAAAGRLLNGQYAEAGQISLVVDPDPTAGGKTVILAASNGSTILRRVLSSAQTTVGVAARYYLSALPTVSSEQPQFAVFSDVSNIIHGWITSDPSGYLQAYRLDSTGAVLVATSTSPVVIANAWRHFEIKWVFSATSGSIDVRLEGATLLSVSGIRTTGNSTGIVATCQNVSIKHAHSSGGGFPSLYAKDYIIWDGSGTVNNTFMGTCAVYKIVPDSDISLNWTASTGTTGWNLINEDTPSDDTGYITAPFPAPSPATFSLTDLPTNTIAVKGVMAVTRTRKTDGGDGQLQLSLISGANTGNGTDRTVTTAYTYWADIFDKDPGGSNWSKTLVNALQVKLNRTV